MRTSCIQNGCKMRNRHSLVDFQFKRAVWRSSEINRSAADVYEMKKGPETAKSEKAYIEIRNHILQFENAPSEPLSEVKLASLLGMSRTPIREALRRLESEGIIITYGTRGSFVNIPTLKDIRDIFEVRMFLEAAAAKLAAKEVDVSRLEEFEKLFEAFRQGKREGDFVDLGRKFHFFIIESSGNKVLKDILDNIYTKLDIIRLFSYSFRRKEAVEEHLKIVRALKKRDEELSYVAMQNHLKNAFNTLTNIL
jgi:DNA-binding GntR family transcriptional regulator